MVRTALVVLSLLTGLAARDAAAQSAAPPVELGFDAAAVVGPNRNAFGRGPRLRLNFDGRNALEMTATLQEFGPSGFGEQQKTDHFLAAFKRVVHADGPVRVFATLGGGLERSEFFTPASGVFPPSTARLWVPAATVGGGVDLRLGRRAAIVLESSFLMTGQFTGRFTAGLVVPVGAYPPSPDSPLASTVPWGDLSEGDRAWVTSSQGREIVGEVVRRSTTALVLRTPAGVETFGLDEITAIDTTDPIRNGMMRGIKIGSVSAAGLSAYVSLLLCAMEECTTGQVVAFNAAFVGMGTGIGAATGALIDSLRERRAPLYRRKGPPNIVITPLLGKQEVGVGTVIRW